MSRVPEPDRVEGWPGRMLEPDWDTIGSEVGIGVRTAALIGEGWSGRVYRVNDEFVFKFPKRAEEWSELEREIGFLAHARPRLSLPVAEHLVQMRSSDGALHGYGVYRHIPASHYGHPDPERLLRKARYFWIVDQVDTIACSEGRAPQADLRAAWRRLRELLEN